MWVSVTDISSLVYAYSALKLIYYIHVLLYVPYTAEFILIVNEMNHYENYIKMNFFQKMA